jgi:hypothetical protein
MQKDPFSLTPEECEIIALQTLAGCEDMQDGWQKAAALADVRHLQRIAQVKRWISSKELRPPAA